MTKYKDNEQLIKERFKLVGVSTLDSKKRITLRNKVINEPPLDDMNIDAFEILVGSEGDILLRPMASIPSKELWVHQNPKVLKSIQRGIQDIKEGRVTKVKNLDKFFKEL